MEITFRLKIYFKNNLSCAFGDCNGNGRCSTGDCLCNSLQYDNDCNLQTKRVSINKPQTIELQPYIWQFFSWPIQNNYMPIVNVNVNGFNADLQIIAFVFNTNDDLKYLSTSGTRSVSQNSMTQPNTDGSNIEISIENSSGQQLIFGVGC